MVISPARARNSLPRRYRSAILAFSYSAITPWTWVSRVACGSSWRRSGASVKRTVTPKPGQLVEDQHLVGVGAGQPVRREAPHRLEQPALGGVAQRVQPGPVQPGTGVAVVDVLTDQLVPGGGHVARAAAASCEPMVPRSACRSVDTRA